jgi:hypothetical protein
MVCYRRCRGVRITQLPQEVGIPVLPHGVRVPQAIALPTLAGAGLPRVTSPRLPVVAGACLALAFTLLARTGALLALAITLLALAGAWLPVAVPVRVPARAVPLGV